MAGSLAQVLREQGQAFLREHSLSTPQARAWRAIVACHTPALGGQMRQCDACGALQPLWHACRNRHCPACQSRQRDAWRRSRLAELLNVPYCHLVFTLPHALNALARQHARWVQQTLMRCTAATLNEFAANPRWLGARPAFTVVLHTWTQDLRLHLHTHALMACGGLGADGRWRTPARGPNFLFPVQALSKVFRGKFLAELEAAQRQGQLPRDPEADRRSERMRALRRHDWVVYAKTPLAGPAAVLDYLSRYTHCTAIGNERIVSVDEGAIRIRVRDRQHPQRGKRTLALAPEEFIGRFLQHVLPPGLKRIRHYGLLAPAAKNRHLAAARAALAMPAPNPLAQEQAADFMRRVAAIDIDRCPNCRVGRCRIVAVMAPQCSAIAAGQSIRAARGPPAT